MLTKEEFEAIRERCEKAIRGPWRVYKPRGYINQIHTVAYASILDNSNFIASVEGALDFENNASFIAHSRTDIPALLDHITELEQRISMYMDAINDVEHRLLDIIKQKNAMENALDRHI